ARWEGRRVPPEHPEHLSIASVRKAAEKVAGERHHFRAVQLPFNLAMGQAAVYRSQVTKSGRQPALLAAREEGAAAFGSASILQGRLSAELPEEIAEAFPGLASSAQVALQVSRSAEGMSAGRVGVSGPEHAGEDFELSRHAPAPPERVLSLFG